MESNEGPRLAPIEWEMMDKNRFFTFSVVNSVALRSVLYPLTVIKTRLQVSLLFIHVLLLTIIIGAKNELSCLSWNS